MGKSLCRYGELMLTKDLVLVESLGLPFLDDYCIVMPKYVYHSSGGPWFHRYSKLKFRRIIHGYGPEGLRRAIELSGIRKINDIFYNYNIPIINYNDIILYINPHNALLDIVNSPKTPYEVYAALAIGRVASAANIRLSEIGLTGSYAGRYYHENSDIDIVVYGYGVEKLYNIFYKINNIIPYTVGKEFLGGIVVTPSINLSWRRGQVRINGRTIGITWIGAPEEPGSHCPPIRDYLNIDRPRGMGAEIVVEIEGGQVEALLYPPCPVGRNGIRIVSFEYNLGGILYKGGIFRVRGTLSESGRTIYLGLREYPGELRLLKDSSSLP